MKNKAFIIGSIFLIVLICSCAGFGTKSPEQLSKEYTSKAQAYEKKGDLVEALKHYKLVLTVDPKNTLAKKKESALESQVRKLAEKHYRMGSKFYNKGQYGQARKEFLTALRYNPNHANAKAKLTITSKDLGKVKRYIVHTLQADESLSTLADRYYGDYRKFHFIAEYNELEDPTKVKVGQEIKIPVVEGIPIISDPGAIKSDSGETADKLPADIIMVKRFVVHKVQPDESLSKLAMMYYGDYSKFDVIAKFNDIAPGGSVRVGQELKIPEVEGLPFMAEGEMEEIKTAAVPKEKAAPKEVPEKQEVIEDQSVNYRDLGIELYNKKEYADAIVEFNKVLNVNPNDKATIDYLALAYYKKGQQSFDKKAYPQAKREFEASLKYNDKCSECQDYIDKIQDRSRKNLRQDAIALYNEKKYKEAIAKFEAVARKNPNDAQVNNYLAKSHFEQGLVLFGKEDYLAARDEFKHALRYDQNCDQCEKNIEKCEATYKQLHYDKGLAYFGDQKLADAIREWESVSRLDPNYKDVNKNLTKAKTLLERLESIKRSKTQENKQ